MEAGLIFVFGIACGVVITAIFFAVWAYDAMADEVFGVPDKPTANSHDEHEDVGARHG